MKARLTKRTADSIQATRRDQYVWDTDIPGFGLKVTPKGRKTFLLQYSSRGRTKRVTLGRFGADLTVDQARNKARALRGEIAAGEDPAAQKARERSLPTLAVFAERYLNDHARVKKKPSSCAADERNLRNHIVPALGSIRVDRISRADISRFHNSMADLPGAANRCLALLSKMMNLAEAWGLRPDGTNPTRHVPKFREHRIERFLSDAELARLGLVLERAARIGEHSSVIAAIRLLLLTGCRRSEILTLKWEDVDFEQRCLRLSDTKTGRRNVALGAPALQVLADLERIPNNPFVLVGKQSCGHFVGINKAWQRLRSQAGLGDVRLHDLRHSFASTGALLGESIIVIGALLGHTEMSSTQRYAHLSNDPLRTASERITSRLDAAMRGADGVVVNMSAFHDKNSDSRD